MLGSAFGQVCRKAGRLRGLAGWDVWHLPAPLLGYILAVHAAAVACFTGAAVSTHWRPGNLLVFAILAGCGAVTVEATRHVRIPRGGVFHDMKAVWYIAAVALLPPVYAFALPGVLTPVRMWRMGNGVPYRRLFTGSACGLAYGCAGLAFHSLPATVAGARPGTGTHVITWLAALACCGALGLAVNNVFIYAAIKLSDRRTRLREMAFDKEATLTDLAQVHLAVLITLPVALSPYLLVAAIPLATVLRRFLMHSQLVSETRIDSKTGLLNAATWQREAEVEIARAVRTRNPLAIAIADLDHFKRINDTRGHLAGDAVLATVSATMSALLREYDLIGRFGGEEFAICLPHTSATEARQAAERVRERISRVAVEIPGTAPVRVTISVGIAVLERSRRDLTELMAAADAALYRAKEQGRNQVCLSSESTMAQPMAVPSHGSACSAAGGPGAPVPEEPGGGCAGNGGPEPASAMLPAGTVPAEPRPGPGTGREDGRITTSRSGEKMCSLPAGTAGRCRTPRPDGRAYARRSRARDWRAYTRG